MTKATDEKVKKIAVEIKPEFYFMLKEHSILTGLKINYLVNRAIENLLKAKKLIK